MKDDARSGGHIPALDGLRALAVAGVLVAHTIDWASRHFHPGPAGVRLFFVLSGFLITGILLRARRRAEGQGRGRGRVLLAFYARRFLRIFPLYYALVLAGTLAGLPGMRESFAWNLAYLANLRTALLGRWPGAPVGHLWSLSVEEQFYLVWPAVVLFAPRRWLPGVFGLTVLAGPLSRAALALLSGNGVTEQVVTFSCLDSLGGGALLALRHAGGLAPAWGERRLAPLALPAGLALLGGVFLLRLGHLAWPVQAVAEDLAYVLLFVPLVDRAARSGSGWVRLLECKPLTYLGTISYGIYLFHYFVPPVAQLLHSRFGVPTYFPTRGGLGTLLYVGGVTVVVAALSWHLFEKVVNGCKDHFPYVPERLGVPAPTAVLSVRDRHARGRAGEKPAEGPAAPRNQPHRPPLPRPAAGVRG